MKIPIDADGVNLPPSQGEQILDEIDVINEQIATIQETLENFETEFNTVNLTAEFISTENIESNTGLITYLDTEESYAKDFYRKRSRFVEGVGEKFLCNIKKNQRATVYCVNDTQSFAVSFINSSGTIISSVPDAIKTISFYDSLDYIGVYVTQDTDVITHFFVEAEKEAVSFTELNRTLIETRDIIDGVSLYGIFNIDIVKAEVLQAETTETPSLIKNSVEGNNTFTHDMATGDDRAFVVTPILSGRTEFYITHNGARLATIYVDVLDSGTNEKLVTFSVAQTDVNIIRVILLDNLLAFETNYTEMVDVAYYTETDLIPAPPFSYVGPTGQITPVFATNITSKLRTVMMGNGTTDVGLTIQGELVASVIQLPEGLSFESVTIGDLTITRTATLAGENIATESYADNVANQVQNNLDTHIAEVEDVHGSTPLLEVNKIIQRDIAGRAKIASPVEDDDIADFITVKGNIADNTTLTPLTHGSVRLTLSNASRTLSDGVFEGQEFTIINSSNTTITINATGSNFTLTSVKFYAKLVWTGIRWVRGLEIPIGTTVWLDSSMSPITEFGGTWSVIGATGEYLAINTSGGGGTATENLPTIEGAFGGQPGGGIGGYFQTASGSFALNTQEARGCLPADGVSRYKNASFRASLYNPKYTSSNVVRPLTRYVKGWRKTAY